MNIMFYLGCTLLAMVFIAVIIMCICLRKQMMVQDMLLEQVRCYKSYLDETAYRLKNIDDDVYCLRNRAIFTDDDQTN